MFQVCSQHIFNLPFSYYSVKIRPFETRPSENTGTDEQRSLPCDLFGLTDARKEIVLLLSQQADYLRSVTEH